MVVFGLQQTYSCQLHIIIFLFNIALHLSFINYVLNINGWISGERRGREFFAVGSIKIIKYQNGVHGEGIHPQISLQKSRGIDVDLSQ